jgi:hypothetical protein
MPCSLVDIYRLSEEPVDSIFRVEYQRALKKLAYTTGEVCRGPARLVHIYQTERRQPDKVSTILGACLPN